jgi:hypothetical protein
MENRSILLSNSEFDYLFNNKQFSKSFEYKIKSQLKKKISIFLESELPLLLQSGLISFNDLLHFIHYNNMLLNFGKEKVGNIHFILRSFYRSWIYSCLL